MVHFLHIFHVRLYRLLDWFIPESLKSDSETLRRARMFLLSHCFGPFLGHTISLYIFMLQPATDLAWWVFFGFIALFWAYPVVLKLTRLYVPLALLSVENLIFVILWGCFHYGGMSSPLLPWVITVPLLAFFYLGSGPWIRAFVLSIIAVNFTGFYAAYLMVGEFPEHIPLSNLSGLGIISTICASIYVSMMALYYANLVTSQSELEREVLSRLETAQRLREATAQAEEANRAKSEFLAKMSHELRTPLNAIIGYSEILLEDAEAAGQQEQCADLVKINHAGKHLLNLITDLLDLSKLEAGKMDLLVETFDLGELLDEVARGCSELATTRGNRLKLECASEVRQLIGDASKLKQVLTNLVGNAAKFTQDGVIEVCAHGAEDRVAIAVSDTGCGIEEQRVSTLFENFEDFKGATSSKYGGTGLGLPLSRKLCCLMGGDIAVESTVGRGSRFTVTLPREIAAGSVPYHPFASTGFTPADAPQGTQILVIDDDPMVLDLVQRILSKEGYSPVVAVSAFEGIELARDLRPNAIILDVWMPELDGWQVLGVLKKNPQLARCPVIMLTVDDDVERGRALGAADHLMKPVEREALLRALERVGLPASTAEGARHARPLDALAV
jgi:signal transduction histidine kinase/CheY-like chemotaxis protein